MGLRIRTNISSLIAQRTLRENSENVRKSFDQLSTGKRINRAADDAAGLAVSETLRSDIRSLQQARRNSEDGISLLQVAEGGLVEVSNIISRLRELAIQSASDTIGERERGFLNREFMALRDEIDRIALSTEFNGSRLIAGNDLIPNELKEGQIRTPLEIQVDKHFVAAIDGKKTFPSTQPINIIRLDLNDINARTEGEGSLNLRLRSDGSPLELASKENAQEALAVFDHALDQLSSHRAHIGAMQNRLESATRNLGIRIENLSHAHSRIMDTDYSQATALYTQNQILQQAGVSILAQANQLPQMALKLLEL